MKKDCLTILVVCLSMACLSGSAEAGLILQPVAASTSMGEFTPASRVIDQSGLSTGYVSMVDDFDAYIASNPTAFHGFGDNVWSAPEGIRSGFFDFDLGGSYLIDSMALWNLVDDISAVRQFNLLVDDNSDFSSPENLGSFTALNNLGSDWSTEAQVFSFAATTASFVRLDILNTWSSSSWSIAFNEAAFRVVPEPNTFALLFMGLFLVGLVRRKTEL